MDDVLGFVRASDGGGITPADLARLRQLFDSHLIPLAIAAGVIGSGATFADLVARYLPDDPAFGTMDHSSAKEIATDNLVTAAGWLDIAMRICEGHFYSESDDVAERLDWMEVAYPAASLTAHTFGYLSAVMDSRRDSGRRATNGRRLVGASTRDRVRREATRYLGSGKAKEEVAGLIANSVGRSFGHVLKTLIKEFPGDKWKGAPEPDASIETAGRNDG